MDVDEPSASGQERPCSLDYYLDRTQLYQGQHSEVCSGTDPVTHQLVVIKSYNKAAMQPRHVRNVLREIQLMMVLKEQR